MIRIRQSRKKQFPVFFHMSEIVYSLLYLAIYTLKNRFWKMNVFLKITSGIVNVEESTNLICQVCLITLKGTFSVPCENFFYPKST